MPNFNKEWKVLPHGEVIAIDDRIVTVEGDISMPLTKFPRRMTVVGLSRNRSAVFSAMALKEQAMRRIEEVGKPSFLIVPNGHHRIDARPWKERYPKLKVLCPPAAKESVSEAVPVDSTDDILGGSDVQFVVVGGTGEAEAALIVRRKDGITLVANDVIANVRHPHGMGGKIIARLAGFGVSRRKSRASSSGLWSRIRGNWRCSCANGRKFPAFGGSFPLTATLSNAPYRLSREWPKSYPRPRSCRTRSEADISVV